MHTLAVSEPLLKSLLVLATVIEARDPCNAGHTWRVSQYGRLLALRAGCSADEVFVACLGGVVHDLGNVAVPDNVLRKSGRLTDAEFAVIKQHPAAGALLVRDHPLSALVSEVVLQHHERFDGQGYPAGLGGQAIARAARIVAIADAFDALTSVRPYKLPLPVDRALEIINDERGKQFDPILVDVFVEMGRKGELNGILGHCAESRPLLSCPECGPVVAAPRAPAGNDEVVCPCCTGIFAVSSLVGEPCLEWLGTFAPSYLPQPDLDAVDEIMQHAPDAIALSL